MLAKEARGKGSSGETSTTEQAVTEAESVENAIIQTPATSEQETSL